MVGSIKQISEKSYGGMCDKMVIIVRNGISELSSNPASDSLVLLCVYVIGNAWTHLFPYE